MHTLKKFIQYYAPYKPVFYFDLVCAAMISLVDLAFPQILRSLTKTLFAGEASQILSALLRLRQLFCLCISYRRCASIMSAIRDI